MSRLRAQPTARGERLSANLTVRSTGLADLKPYPAMMDSGIFYLGQVPEHWTVAPVARVGQLFKGNGGNKGDEASSGFPCIRYGDLYTRHEYSIYKAKSCVSSERASLYTPIRYGDILFAASGETFEDIGRSAANLIRGEARCGGDVLVLRPLIDANPKFFGYACDCPSSKHQKASMGRGFTVVHIYAAELKQLALAIPPFAEQATIVRFLDHANRYIDRYVRAKRKLRNFLDEQKQLIIHHAVTRGLHASAQLKRSGVTWVAEIPTHWKVVRNGQLFTQRNETGFADLPILEVSLRTGVRIRDFENSVRKQVMADRGKYKRATKGDIAYNMMRMWQGAVGIAPVDGLVSPAYIVAKPLEAVEPRYFVYLFRTTAYLAEIDAYSRGIVKDRNRLYWEDFKQIRSCCPPFDEQVRIADAIDAQTKDINHALARIGRQIELVQEYRSRLVDVVVTGKVDVREVADRLPDVEEVIEATDEPERAGDDDDELAEGQPAGEAEA